MYLLDTNLISEFRKVSSGKVNKNVVAWQRTVAANVLFLSVITVMELEIGTMLLERRDHVQSVALRRWVNDQVKIAFAGRILPIDTHVAQRCAQLHVPDRRSERDALIAATALVHNMTVVTRNVADFSATGVDIINPWIAG